MNERPSTYFLQEAIDRGLAAIESRLDKSQENRPFFMIELNPIPLMVDEIWDLGDMCARYVDAFILGRQVTGNAGYMESEQSLRTMLQTCDPYAEPFMAGRMLITYVDIYLQDKSDLNRNNIINLVNIIKFHLTFEDDFAYYFKSSDRRRFYEDPIFGSFLPYPTYPIGGIMLALARYLDEEDDLVIASLLERLTVFVLRESGTFAPDSSYYGHTHSGGILTAAAAIFRRAIHTEDTDRIEFMMKVLDWTLAHSSSWGWVPDGLGSPDPSGETCSLVDALHLLLLAANHVDSSYFDVVERFARNQLIENQFRYPEKMLPEGDFQDRSRIEKAITGSWASWSLPNSLDNGLQHIEGCCLGAGIRGCFLVWDNIVSFRDGTVYVNIGISRNSQWAEVISYIPYAGRIDVLMHQSLPLSIRIPSWVWRDSLVLTVNSEIINLVANAEGYFELGRLDIGDHVSLEFPMLSQNKTEKVSGMTCNVKWHGDTIIGIEPAGELYPIFDREYLLSPHLPMISAPYLNQTGGPVHF
ncbi:MAG: hypothetical protein ACYC0V_16120 [Armatimonadota bacterium]